MDTREARIILGLPSSATPTQIKEAYRDLARVWHPDRFDNDPRLRVKVEEKLKEINQAYDVLRTGSASDQAPPPSSSSRNYDSSSVQWTGTGTQSEPEPPPPPTPPQTTIRRAFKLVSTLDAIVKAVLITAFGGLMVAAVLVVALYLFGIQWGW